MSSVIIVGSKVILQGIINRTFLETMSFNTMSIKQNNSNRFSLRTNDPSSHRFLIPLKLQDINSIYWACFKDEKILVGYSLIFHSSTAPVGISFQTSHCYDSLQPQQDKTGNDFSSTSMQSILQNYVSKPVGLEQLDCPIVYDWSMWCLQL